MLLWTALWVLLIGESNHFASSLLVPAIITCLGPLLIWYMAASGGPQLAVGPQGMWVRTRTIAALTHFAAGRIWIG